MNESFAIPRSATQTAKVGTCLSNMQHKDTNTAVTFRLLILPVFFFHILQTQPWVQPFSSFHICFHVISSLHTFICEKIRPSSSENAAMVTLSSYVTCYSPCLVSPHLSLHAYTCRLRCATVPRPYVTRYIKRCILNYGFRRRILKASTLPNNIFVCISSLQQPEHLVPFTVNCRARRGFGLPSLVRRISMKRCSM